MKIKFNSCDIVIMQSIFVGQGLIFKTGASIKTIQKLNDSLDRSKYNFDETVSSLTKLYNSDLITFKNNKIYLTKRYRILRKKVKNTSQTFTYESDRIDAIFHLILDDNYIEVKEIPDNLINLNEFNTPYYFK